jgi:acetyl/propionyl-CoA carboxylase alpha subunit
VTRWVEPVGGSLRIDTHCYGGYTVPPYYDSLLAKLIAHGRDRAMSELASESSTQRPREAASERSEARRSATRTATRSPTRS